MQEQLIIHEVDGMGRYVKVKTVSRENWRYFQMGHLTVKYACFNFRNVNVKEIGLHITWMLKQKEFSA